MKRPVQWSRDALDDLTAQLVHIAADDLSAARHVAARIETTAAGLADFATGRPGRVTGTYEKSVNRLPYIIAYALVPHSDRESIAILRIIHTARDWPDEDWPPQSRG